MLASPQSPSCNTTRSNILVSCAYLLHELATEIGVALNSFYPEKGILPLATALVRVIAVGEIELWDMSSVFTPTPSSPQDEVEVYFLCFVN